MREIGNSEVAALVPAGKRHPFGFRALARRLFSEKGECAAEPMRYDAEDIEEANRIGAAIRRQHAR